MRINSPHLNLIYKACIKASKSLIRDFGEIEKLQVSTKGPGDFVTSADKKIEKILIEELSDAHPDYGILSEEVGEIKSKSTNKRWIIDPIDGTSNFMNGVPQFAISVAYEDSGEIKSGIIFDPIKNEMFFADKGSGAFLNNSRIRVSKKKSVFDALFVTGGPHKSSKNKKFIFDEYKKVSENINFPIRKMGSAALDIAYVASGRFDCFWQREINYWDIAAGIIILKEAGGLLELKNNGSKLDIICSNSNIFDNFRELLK
tara:strand:+ start:206 stop:982 length:777 start_codon:yes stop_codon:yes gene_type:complete